MPPRFSQAGLPLWTHWRPQSLLRCRPEPIRRLPAALAAARVPPSSRCSRSRDLREQLADQAVAFHGEIESECSPHGRTLKSTIPESLLVVAQALPPRSMAVIQSDA